jgi:chromosome partitioning protein
LLVDFDSQANLTTGLGFDPDEQDSAAPVLQGNKDVEEIIVKTGIERLDLIPADTWLERVEVTGALASDRYSHERLREALRPLKYDFCIIDTPPSLCWLTESALIAANKALVCTTPEFYSVKGLDRLAQFIEHIGQRHLLEVLGVVMSFWSNRGKSNDAFLEVLESTFPKKSLKTKIRRHVSVSDASIKGEPVFSSYPTSNAAQDYQELTKEILKKCNK